MKDETTTVQGFAAAAGKGGIRGKDRLDIGLIVCDKPATAAGVFTTSLVKAAPVLLDMERLQSGRAQAILVNSGIANACSGEEGMRLARAAAKLAADTLNIPPEMVLVASTGVIGPPLDLSCFEKAVPRLAADLAPHGFNDVAQAIMTTDTVPKTAVRTATIGGTPARLLGIAKGAGMIMPNMATMLCFVLTDALVADDTLQAMLRSGVAQSFNRITVDGDTSTNDTVLILANGRAGNPAVADDNPAGIAAFQQSLDELLKDLALQIVADGEGATKLVTVRVQGARNDEEAEAAARTVANSPLVKTAFFGEDANWGRIIAALGRSGAVFDPEQVDIGFDGVYLVRDGLGQGAEAEAQASVVLKRDRFTLNLDLKNGEAACEIHTCDLSLDYIKINADYRS